MYCVLTVSQCKPHGIDQDDAIAIAVEIIHERGMCVVVDIATKSAGRRHRPYPASPAPSYVDRKPLDTPLQRDTYEGVER